MIAPETEQSLNHYRWVQGIVGESAFAGRLAAGLGIVDLDAARWRATTMN